MSRINALRYCLATILGGVLMLSTAHAAAPLVKTSAPGYYRMTLGAFEVTALSDGTADLPFTQLLNAPKANIEKALAKSFLKDPVESSFNGFLINTGSKLVLIDTGAGKLFGPTLGRLAANLQAAGYQPEQVDEIYITHMHPDHIGGLASDGKRVFPNAIVRVDQHDADFWLSAANLEAASKDDKGFFQGAMASLKPYIDAGQFKPFDGNTDLVPGIKAIAARGHTPGHSIYSVESQGQKLLLWGDLIHLGAMQFAAPDVTIKFDTDNKSAAVQRKKAFAEAAANGYWVAAAHLSFPGIGHVRHEGKAYAWVPANYTAAR
jgi:glyoxylase-like metal-dependent hydrolase (beta-lactamase superfamily II)